MLVITGQADLSGTTAVEIFWGFKSNKTSFYGASQVRDCKN